MSNIGEGHWGHHDVFLGTDGIVFDPMRPFASGLPFDQWAQTWENLPVLNFDYLGPGDFSLKLQRAYFK